MSPLSALHPRVRRVVVLVWARESALALALLVLCGVLVLAGASASHGSPPPAAEPDGFPYGWRSSSMPLCLTEDAPGPCVWLAHRQGNGGGVSFVVLADQSVVLLP